MFSVGFKTWQLLATLDFGKLGVLKQIADRL